MPGRREGANAEEIGDGVTHGAFQGKYRGPEIALHLRVHPIYTPLWKLALRVTWDSLPHYNAGKGVWPATKLDSPS